MIVQPNCASLRLGKLSAALVLGAIFSFSCALAQPPAAQVRADASVDRAHIAEALGGLSRGRTIAQTAISPDGRRQSHPMGGGLPGFNR